jgi:hypothetical protein
LLQGQSALVVVSIEALAFQVKRYFNPLTFAMAGRDRHCPNRACAAGVAERPGSNGIPWFTTEATFKSAIVKSLPLPRGASFHFSPLRSSRW